MFDDILAEKTDNEIEKELNTTHYVAICPICSSYCTSYEYSRINNTVYAICYVCNMAFEI